jgi:hypothetical protein
VVVLANSSGIDTRSLAGRVADLFLETKLGPETPRRRGPGTGFEVYREAGGGEVAVLVAARTRRVSRSSPGSSSWMSRRTARCARSTPPGR